MKKNRILCAGLALVLGLSLTACSAPTTGVSTETEAPASAAGGEADATEQPSQDTASEPSEEVQQTEPPAPEPTVTAEPTPEPPMMVLAGQQLYAFSNYVGAPLVELCELQGKFGAQYVIADMSQQDWEDFIWMIDVTLCGEDNHMVDGIFGDSHSKSSLSTYRRGYSVQFPAYQVDEYLYNAFGSISLDNMGRHDNGGFTTFETSSGDDPNLVMPLGNAESVPISADGILRINYGLGSFEIIPTVPNAQLEAGVTPAPDSPYGCHVEWFRVNLLDQASSGADSTSVSFDSNGFVFADSSTRQLTATDLAGLSQEALGFARNEIFARHGNIFQNEKYRSHYEGCSWYTPVRAGMGFEDLNDIERANVELIQSYES